MRFWIVQQQRTVKAIIKAIAPEGMIHFFKGHFYLDRNTT